MSDTRKQLQRAYRSIERQKTAEALAILRPLTEQDPDNPDVWWLMAYALDDPQEVRAALITVLRLDPNYSNASKARELLQTLNDQHPPTQDEMALFPDFLGQYSAFPDAFAGEETELFGAAATEMLFDEPDGAYAGDPFEDIFASPDSSPSSGGFETYDEPFDVSVFEIDDDLLSADEQDQPAEKSRKERRAEQQAEKERQRAAKQAERAVIAQMDDINRLAHEKGIDIETADDITLADLEELAANGPRRRSRLVRILASAAVVVAILVGAVLLLGGDKDTDPGPLKVLEAASVRSDLDLSAVENSIRAANLSSDSQVVMAKSDLGTTLYVVFCGVPNSDLPASILQGMDTIARQAGALQGAVDAVGVSVNACGGETSDTLYRAVIGLDDALAYAAEADTASARPAFQAQWQTP